MAKIKAPQTDILFRVGSYKHDGGISYSHFNRCLALANELHRNFGQKVGFLIDNDRYTKKYLKKQGHEVYTLQHNNPAYESAMLVQSRSQVIIFDGIDLDIRIPGALANTQKKLVVIDDTGNKRLNVDVVLNGTFVGGRYRYGRALKPTRFFLGPKYCILDPAYDDFPVRKTNAQIKTVLVSMGAVDATGMTCRIADLFKDLAMPFEVVYVIGPGFHAFEKLEQCLNNHGGSFYFVHAPDSMIPLLATADLAIVSGGRTCYEAARVGVPTITVPTAAHQELVASAMGEKGATFPVPYAWKLPKHEFDAQLLDLMDLLNQSKKLRDQAVINAHRVVDSLGRNRAAQVVMSCLSPQFRRQQTA